MPRLSRLQTSIPGLVLITILALSGAALAASAEDKPGMTDKKPKIADKVYVKLATSMGDVILELDGAKAPISTANFLEYVNGGFYDGTIFHRVMKDFVVQGGGFTADMKQKDVRAPIKNEWQNGLKNVRGSIAMARTQVADSATSQFYINVADNSRLDEPNNCAAYAVFGMVYSGMDVVDKLREVPVTSKGDHQNVPVEPVTILKGAVLSNDELKPFDESHKREAEARNREAEARRRAVDRQFKEFEKMIEPGMAFVKAQGVDTGKGVGSPSGLWHVDTKEGSGTQPSPCDRVKVHYTGWLTNGKKFDSSVDRGEPSMFGLNRVIRGWTEGVGGMKPGGKRWLVIPPQLGYGEHGQGGSIPPNSVLVFEIELFEIVK